jgi:hypothetical protein
MLTSNPQVLSSLTREAGRQSDFYRQRGDQALSDFWSDVEALAFECRKTGAALHIEKRENSSIPFPIKRGE